MNWNRVLGRVSFVNCDPLFHGISDNWGVLPAPPSWLTGHVLKKDCLVAPIPTAAYAEHHSDLILLLARTNQLEKPLKGIEELNQSQSQIE